MFPDAERATIKPSLKNALYVSCELEEFPHDSFSPKILHFISSFSPSLGLTIPFSSPVITQLVSTSENVFCANEDAEEIEAIVEKNIIRTRGKGQRRFWFLNVEITVGMIIILSLRHGADFDIREYLSEGIPYCFLDNPSSTAGAGVAVTKVKGD